MWYWEIHKKNNTRCDRRLRVVLNFFFGSYYDLCCRTFYGRIIAFADGNVLTYILDFHSILQTSMLDDLNKINFLFTKSKMIMIDKIISTLFNQRSTKAAYISRKYYSPDCNQLLNNATCENCLTIPHSSNIKYLHVIFDQNLTWKLHVTKLQSLLTAYIWELYYLRYLCPVEIWNFLF